MGQTQLFPFHLALDHMTARPQPRDIPQPVPSAGGSSLVSCLGSNGRAVTHSCPITRLPGYKALKNLLLSQCGVVRVRRGECQGRWCNLSSCTVGREAFAVHWHILTWYLTLPNLPVFSDQAESGPLHLEGRSRPICCRWWAPSQGSACDFSTHQRCNNASFVSVFFRKSC